MAPSTPTWVQTHCTAMLLRYVLILELKLKFDKKNLIKKNFFFQPGDYNALLEIPGGVRLVARSVEPVTRGTGSARPSAIQPPAGIRPLPLTSEVSLTFSCKFVLSPGSGLWFPT